MPIEPHNRLPDPTSSIHQSHQANHKAGSTGLKPSSKARVLHVSPSLRSQPRDISIGGETVPIPHSRSQNQLEPRIDVTTPPTILLTPASNPTGSSIVESRSPSPQDQVPSPPPATQCSIQSVHESFGNLQEIYPSVPITTQNLPSDGSEQPLTLVETPSDSHQKSISHPIRKKTPTATSGRRTSTIRMSPGVMAMLSGSRSNSLSSSSTSAHGSSKVGSSEGSSAKYSQPQSSILRAGGNFSPTSNTTTEHTSLPQDAFSPTLPSPQTCWAPSTRQPKTFSQLSDQSSSLFGIGKGDETIPDRAIEKDLNSDSVVRPSTSIGSHSESVEEPEHDRRPHSSLPATGDSSSMPLTLNNAPERGIPSFRISSGDQDIEELLETLGYSSGLSKSNSLNSIPTLSKTDLNYGNFDEQQRDDSRRSVMMLDIDGQEFSIHEHSLSPVSERTELDTNSSQASSKRQQKPPSISQALLSKRYSPQTKFSSTAPLCLSPKAATNLLSPPSSTSSASPSNLNRSNQANSSHSISPQDVDHSSSPNLTERAKLFGNSKPIRKKREVCSEKKTSEPEHDFSPKFSHNSFGASSQSNYHSHPSLQRVPKRTTQLIQLFESGSSPTSPTHSMLNTEAISRSKSPANRAQLSSGEKISPIEALEASRRARNARNQRIKPSLPQYLALAAEGHYSLPPSSSPEVRSSETCIPTSPSLDSINTNAVLEPSQAELEHMKLRTERRERTAQAENVRLNSLPKKAKDLPPSTEQRSPMSDEFIRHRKSIASSVTSNFSESKVLISGMIWYRNPQSQKWKETRGILTPKALYLANEGGEIDPASPGQSIELDLTGCTSVESIRSKRSYGPDFSEPHLHLLRITWAEFDHRINSRVEHEEFLACGRATQRADWVGAIWQAAHDLGGFVDQPDIPLRGKTSTTSVSPPNADLATQCYSPDSGKPVQSHPTRGGETLSPTSRLNPVSLIDRSMSGAQSSKFPDYAPISTMNSFSPAPHSPLSIPIDPQRSSLVSSGSSDVSAATTTLQSELDRELATSADSCNKIPPANPNSLYSHNENNVNSVVDPSHSSYPIDPNLEQSSSRPKSPELDIFAMLDRMSIRGGSIHRNTAQFYDPPQLSSSHRQSSHDMHNPYPINIHDQANISELEQGANETLDSTSQSFRTMRPDSPAGFHEQLSASSLSSRTGFKAHTERENVVRQLPSTPRPERSHVGQLAGSSTEDQLNVNSRGFSIDRNSADHEKNNVYRGRGAWSDDERASYQTDNVLQGPIPSKAVQRDLRKILNTIGHNDSRRAAATDSLGQYLDSIQHQLKNVAAKLKAHGPEREPGFEVEENEEPTIADKVDYMLSLCNILLESQHKVSTAVEQNLRAHGLNIDNNSVRTRSLGSGFKNSTRHCSYVSPEPGMPGPAPLTPAGSYLDEDRSKAGSPPLPPLPDNEAAEEQEEPTPEALPPVAVQEAGLGRIENLLVALLNRMDDAAQRPQESVAPPVPEKELSVTEPRQSSFGGTNSSILDLDADVALWKSRARGDEASSCGKESDSKSFSQEPEADFANVEGKNVSSESTETASTPQNYQTIPDYNLAYEAEEEVARRIADERARAARRLEGASTPLHYHQLGLSSRYPVPFGARAPIQSVEVTNFTPPNQDFDPYRLSVSSKNATFQKAQDHSYWSKTTNTENINEDPVPPPPPPKDDQASTRSHSQPASSIRSPSRVSSSVISSRKSPPRPISANPEPVLSSIPPEQIRELLMEVLQQHSTEKEPVFDEMVSVLRNQDQVNKASVLNQAEVSRYLAQLNVHLEGVLLKKDSQVTEIIAAVARLEQQLAVLIERSNQVPLVASTTINDRPMSISLVDKDYLPQVPQEPDNDDCKAAAQGDDIQVDPGEEPELPIDVSAEPDNNSEGEEAPIGEDEPKVSSMLKRPSASYRIGGPRARKISLGKSLGRGPRMPAGLSAVGKLWGGPQPAGDRAARWGTAGSLKRSPTKKTQASVDVQEALAAVNTDDPAGQEAVQKQLSEDVVDDKAGTIALGVSHILKFLRENQEEEKARREKKEAEKAAAPKPAIPNEMEERRAKIEELQLKREAALAEDKAKKIESMMQAMKQQSMEQDKLLKKIAEELEAQKSKAPEDEEAEKKKRYEEAMDGVNRVLTTIESGVLTHLEDFKAQMFSEMKQTFEKVGELREQKQQIQADIADMFAFMSRVKGGAPDPRWHYPIATPPVGGGVLNEEGGGSVAGGNAYRNYPTTQIDDPDREGTEYNGGVAKSVSGFGPRPPGRR